MTDGYWPQPHAEHFAASDVYFAQLAIIYQLCTNGAELFAVDSGGTFGCEFDRAGGIDRVKRALLSNEM